MMANMPPIAPYGGFSLKMAKPNHMVVIVAIVNVLIVMHCA
jgi:hypothetical protein